jgi:hypothetical protein
MRAVLVSAVLAGTLTFGAQAAEEKVNHLAPTWSFFDVPSDFVFVQTFRSTFKEAWDPDVEVRQYFVGGLPVEAVSTMRLLEKRATAYRVVVLTSDAAIVPYAKEKPPETKSSLPPSPPPEVSRCEAALSASLGDNIVRAWRSTLMDTKFLRQSHVPPPDSGYIYFSATSSSGPMSGQLPGVVGETESKPAMLMDIGEAMESLCRHADGAHRAMLARSVDVFLKRYR